MRLSSPLRGIAVILVVIAAAALYQRLIGGSDDADGASGGSPVAARDLLLRLHDLPPGYVNYAGPREGDDREEPLCSHLTKPTDTPAALASVIKRFRPGGCLAAYARLYTVPEIAPTAAMLGTGAMRLGSNDAADAVWKVVPTMLGRVAGNRPPRPVPTATTIGDETILLHAPVPPFPLNYFGKKASYLVWRSGTVLATVLAVTDSYAQADQIVADLAPKQQEHVLEPTPYTKAERFDAEVGLDDPAIPFPLYWLGRKFTPGGKLPPNQLYESGYRGKPLPESNEGGIEEGPGAPLEVNYNNIWLETWTSATWSVFSNSKAGRAITSWKCTQTRSVALPEGSATIFGGYKKDTGRCPKSAPKAFTAWVDLGGVKVVVNAPAAADFIELVNPYGSFAGMEAIVRSLKLRPKPLYRAPPGAGR
jgi:hypothetical protein